MDNNPDNTDSTPAPAKKGSSAGSQLGMAIELPVVFVGTVVLGGGLGFLLDHWLHTKFLFMFVFGAAGFVAGLREILRRLPG
ncbi:MAG: AtpZ/AtpI family protein [Candidatus Acidiferrum sp.]